MISGTSVGKINELGGIFSSTVTLDGCSFKRFFALKKWGKAESFSPLRAIDLAV
jgi:hypothetical protein